MVRYELVLTEAASEEDFPLLSADVRLEVEVDFGDMQVPGPAARRMAVQALQRLINDMDGSEFDSLDGEEPATPRSLPERPPRPVTYNAEGEWIRPAGIDMRIVKSAHRIIKEVANRGENGRAVLASELVQDGLVSAPTMSRLLRDDETAGQYLEPFVMVSQAGRTKALDLTPKGRLLASKIRAGVIPS